MTTRLPTETRLQYIHRKEKERRKAITDREKQECAYMMRVVLPEIYGEEVQTSETRTDVRLDAQTLKVSPCQPC